MKIMTLINLTLMVVFLFTGCSKDSDSNAKECLKNERLNFNDPDATEFVVNLGLRGNPEKNSNGFWVRYKSKNLYGAYAQGNMFCSNVDGTWRRNKTEEYLYYLDVVNRITGERISRLKAEADTLDRVKDYKQSKSMREFYESNRASEKQPEDIANELVYVLPDNLY